MVPRPRLELHNLFLTLCPNVYFQPPPKIKMTYPCIRYKRDTVPTDHADNMPYKRKRRYQVTVIDEDPEGVLADQVGALPSAVHDRNYAADDLNHDVFNLFF